MGCENGYVEPAQRAAQSPTDPRVDVPPTAVVPEKHRLMRSPKDIAMSLLVLLVPIAVLLGFYRVVLDADAPVVVDPAPVVAEARSANAFPVSEPTGLGDGWHPTSAGFRQVDGARTLRIGYVTPSGGGLQLVQSNVPVEKLLPAELTDAAQSEGSAQVGGRAWQRYTARRGEQALVLLEPTRTVLIVGGASEAELTTLAGAVR
ncbi:DUF4245 domain-containing protein [Micromonospora sp. NPDC049679]|uniref:DUF4245 domain-containing protein n=1 Tax=Micromonospora sp. NPDC049679 TaxID=3155920 RepID=UPI0033E116C0